tara:strand:- start:1575 stop:1829 length:255 start_codon:yes stop_codon:yes gene_type:complete
VLRAGDFAVTEQIAVIAQAARERIEVNLTRWRGHDLDEARVNAYAPSEWVSTAKCLTVRAEALSRLVRTISDAEGMARELGLIL